MRVYSHDGRWVERLPDLRALIATRRGVGCLHASKRARDLCADACSPRSIVTAVHPEGVAESSAVLRGGPRLVHRLATGPAHQLLWAQSAGHLDHSARQDRTLVCMVAANVEQDCEGSVSGHPRLSTWPLMTRLSRGWCLLSAQKIIRAWRFLESRFAQKV